MIILSVCVLCGAPILGLGQRLCRRCRQSTVRSQEDVKRALPPVKARLNAMGVRLAAPVQVTLVAEPDMQALYPDVHGVVKGVTFTVGTKVLQLSVIGGLPEVEFGMVVAHECMHAWMAQHGYPKTSPQWLVEGLCQLASYGFLRNHPDPGAGRLRARIESDPSPVYGDGFRAVKAAVEKHGRVKVFDAVRATGGLP